MRGRELGDSSQYLQAIHMKSKQQHSYDVCGAHTSVHFPYNANWGLYATARKGSRVSPVTQSCPCVTGLLTNHLSADGVEPHDGTLGWIGSLHNEHAL